jgi:large subunit ribosomal protein L29
MESRMAHLRNLRGLTADELEGKVTELKKDLFNLRFQLVAGRIESPAKIRATRRDIARIQTLMREKALGREKGAAS